MLSQENAEKLMRIFKKILDPHLFQFPETGRASIEIVSIDERASFRSDINRGRIKPSKASFNMIYKSPESPVIYRLDINGPDHKNPDDVEIPCPHLHIYRENYGDAWAIPAPDEIVNSNNPAEVLIDFLHYCRIQNTSAIAVNGDLFE